MTDNEETKFAQNFHIEPMEVLRSEVESEDEAFNRIGAERLAQALRVGQTQW